MKKSLIYLFAIAALMTIGTAAMAQGGLAPFVGSTHDYTVTAEDDVNNVLDWTVSGGTLGTDYTIVSGEDEETVTIKWLTAGPYTLQFTETANGTSCVTLKQANVLVGANTFDVSTSSPTAICNGADGSTNFTGPNATTDVTFTVAMVTGNAAFNPNWRFTFELSSVSGATFASVEVDGNSVTPSGSTYTSPDLASASGAATIDVTMEVTGDAFAVQDAIFAIQSAIELTYNTPDIDTDDWTGTQTINAIPNTSGITTD